MRVQVAFTVFFALGSAGCEWISGVSGYEEAAGTRVGSAGHPTPDAGLAEQDSGSASKDGRPPVGTDAGDDHAPDDDGVGSSQNSAGPEAIDGSVAGEAGNIPDAAPNPPPPCGPMTCANCCSGGHCVGGRSVATCGTGGEDCKDCTTMGGACDSHGSCAAPDAAPPPACNPAKCAGCGFYTLACCKSDQTCGCEIDYVVGITSCL